MNKVKVLLADDHQIFLEGLRGLLEAEYEIVGMAGDGHTLIKEALRLKPDVIITDISMPSLNGIDAIRQIRKEGLNPRVIFLTMHNDVMYAKEVLDMGASGFILKLSASSELITAIQEALRGHTHISPVISQELLDLYKGDKAGSDGVLNNLSLRQREVLQLLAEGKSVKEIARVLKVSPRTVEFHKYSAMRLLDVKTNAELVHYIIKHDIV